MDIDALGVGGADACSSGLSVAVAAGPFTLADDLAYDPLHELLQDLKASPPNMLVGFDVLIPCFLTSTHLRISCKLCYHD